jgi:hypothetical protein
LLFREGFADEVVDLRAQRELAALHHEVDAIREQRDDAFGVEIDPERGPREAEVADRGA